MSVKQRFCKCKNMKEQLWLPNVKCLSIAVETSQASSKNKCYFQTWNTTGIIDVKEQIWLANIKHFMGISILLYIHMCKISKAICRHKGKEMCQSNKKYISGH